MEFCCRKENYRCKTPYKNNKIIFSPNCVYLKNYILIEKKCYILLRTSCQYDWKHDNLHGVVAHVVVSVVQFTTSCTTLLLNLSLISIYRRQIIKCPEDIIDDKVVCNKTDCWVCTYVHIYIQSCQPVSLLIPKHNIFC